MTASRDDVPSHSRFFHAIDIAGLDPVSGPRRRRPRAGLAAPIGVMLALLAAAAVVVPNRLADRRNANESAAIATLKNIGSAQAQLQASGLIDVDRDGMGEYGFLAELSGAVVGRSGRRVAPPVLSAAFGDLVESRATVGGYLFQVYLPDHLLQGVIEDADGGDAGNDNGVSARHAAALWCCYAWPVTRGWSGDRTFFTNQSGDVLGTNGAVLGYDGLRHPCGPLSAFVTTADTGLGSAIAVNAVGSDGNFWVIIG